MKDQGRYLGLEALRFLSAVAVVVWHYQHFYMGQGEVFLAPFTRERQPLFWALEAFYDHGYLAVWAFWQISGFIFFWKYHEAVARGEVSPWSFFVLRFSRLYPLHFATLLITAALQFVYAADHLGQWFVYANNDAFHFALNLVMAPAWGFQKGESFNGPIWSVSVEVVVYALFFAFSMRRRLGLVGRLAVVVAAIGLWALNSKVGQLAGVRTTLNCLTYFYMGGVVHALVADLSPALVRRTAPIAIVGALVLAWATFIGIDQTPKWAILVFSTLLLYGFVGIDRLPGAEPILARIAPLSDTTYSSYLVHFPLQVIAVTITDRLGLERGWYDGVLPMALYLVATFWLGWIVFHRFERPTQSVLRRLMLPESRTV